MPAGDGTDEPEWGRDTQDTGELTDSALAHVGWWKPSRLALVWAGEGLMSNTSRDSLLNKLNGHWKVKRTTAAPLGGAVVPPCSIRLPAELIPKDSNTQPRLLHPPAASRLLAFPFTVCNKSPWYFFTQIFIFFNKINYKVIAVKSPRSVEKTGQVWNYWHQKV